MSVFRRSASHQRVMELEAEVEMLHDELVEESARTLVAEARAAATNAKLEQAEARYKELNRKHIGALMAVRVLMLATKAKPFLVWFKEAEKK